MAQACRALQGRLGRNIDTVVLENELLSATVIVNKGADIYELRYKPRDVDVLWKSPWGLRDPGYELPSSSSLVSWLDGYGGGWQVLFPSGGGPCTYKGVELPFNGEASLAPWDCQILTEGGDVAEVRLEARLARSPLRIERTMRVEAGRPMLTFLERVGNEGREPVDYLWGHHPAYGAPFLSEACRIDTAAQSLRADDAYDGPHNPLELDRTYRWPEVDSENSRLDLSHVPGEETPRQLLAYLGGFKSGWYAITNAELGFGVGLVWPAEVLPYAWLWQEMHASPGYPWYQNAYVMAIEPNTSFPAQGLVAAMAKTGTHRTLEPGEFAELEFGAVFYESSTGVARIESDGVVHLVQ